MAGCRLTSLDVFSAANSIGASAFIDHLAIGIFFNKPVLFSSANSLNAYTVQALDKGAFAYRIKYYGFINFQIFEVGTGYAHRFGEKLGIGLRFNYHHIGIKENGNKSALSFDLGMLYKISEHIRLAVHIKNPAKQKLEPLYKETLPTEIAIGAAYHPNENFTIATELRKDLQFPLQFSLGFNYAVHPHLALRSGLGINPILMSGGIGFNWHQLTIDLSSVWNVRLGYSPQISLSYAIKKKTKD